MRYDGAGSTEARGYGTDHQRARREWARIVAAGDAHCAAVVCLDPAGTGRWIMPGSAWDLDHDDDRTGYRGPAHAACNRSAGGIRGNKSPRRRQGHSDRVPNESRDWNAPLRCSEDWWGTNDA